jgi:tRNA 5-methylaminomethyl-2-thiouridine biosynthesis bifunctional protein
MQNLLDRQALPASFVQALPAAMASQQAGLALLQAAWFYPDGGWIDPAALVRDALATPGVAWCGATAVQRIARAADAWQLFDADDRVIAEAPLLVLANAADALRLAGLPAHWLQSQRGQLSWTAGVAGNAPRIPVASGGYALRLPSGALLFGATNQPDDKDPTVRDSDHVANRAKATLLLGADALQGIDVLHGRTAWRATAPDRLPLVGPVPELAAPRPPRADAPRLLPRQPGLWLHSGLGSRGLTTATLCAELIAAQVSGAPWPLEADLADAIDPARWLLREG